MLYPKNIATSYTYSNTKPPLKQKRNEKVCSARGETGGGAVAPTPPQAGATHPCTRGSVVRSIPCLSCGLASLEGGERYEGRLLPVPLARGTGSAASPSFGTTQECGRLEAGQFSGHLAACIYRGHGPLWPWGTLCSGHLEACIYRGHGPLWPWKKKKPRRTEAFSLLRL